jgi:polysaccharide export outer membrane protein
MNWKLLFVSALLVSAAFWTQDLSAQDAVQQAIQARAAGRQVSTEEIIAGLRESGLSRAQVAQRLRQQGLDPALADQYFDVLEGGAEEALEPSADFLAALERMGMVFEDPDAELLDMDLEADSLAALDSLDIAEDSDSIAVFGTEVFRSRTTRFDPLRMGPVDASYRLGPDDQIRLVLTGDVELAYTLGVTREGSIVIPDVGQVSVNGRTLSDLENVLYERLGRVYSGVRRGADATTFFDVSLGRLRTNQVFLVGEVESPGAYQISSVASAFNALHAAGGPTEIGSFRAVLVRRGGETVATVDLYDYLLSGDVSDDVRLEQGDVVFVPLAGPQVRMTGEVRREAIYELKQGEDIRDAIGFAGGLTAAGDGDRILIDRVIPPSERLGLTQRSVVDVRLTDLPEDSLVLMHDGDLVEVFAVRDMRRDRVTIQGQVFRPGDYTLFSGMTAWDLVSRAGGLLPDAFRPVVHISRLNEADSTRTLVQMAFGDEEAGAPAENRELVDQDILMVFGSAELRVPESVSVVGLVKNPDSYDLARGMTAEDLILLAGGFAEGANGLNVDVVRPIAGLVRNDTISVTYSLSLDGSVPWALDEASAPEGPAASEFLLMDGDRVFVRQMAGFVRFEAATIIGEVARPGAYGFRTRRDRVSDFVALAGGFTPEAYISGARLVRDSVLVGLDLERALASPLGDEDLILWPGDRLEIPQYDGTVLVTGEVRVVSRVPFGEGLSLGDYLERAGGVGAEGDRGKAYVEHASGRRDVSRKFLFFRSDPGVQPGSTIFIPRKIEGGGFNADVFLSRALSVLGTLATVLIASKQLGGA